MTSVDFSQLHIKGEVHQEVLYRIAYSTDASAYREMPLGVALPMDKQDVLEIIRFAKDNKINLIPRAAGTSLAGQVVGKGLVVDISKYMNKILEVNAAEQWVRVQPGVVRDELNIALKPYGLFFSPETSTSNRCCVGGMVGNNSCGTHSLRYGSTREHLMEAEVILSDGSCVLFRPLTNTEVEEKLKLQTLEGDIYRFVVETLRDENNQQQIKAEYPHPNLKRRNNGYALDQLLYSNYFTEGGEPFNLCKLLCGSEGTLAFATELKLHVDQLPPPHKLLVCVHCHTLEESLKANILALKHQPAAVELMDDKILELSKQNASQRVNRFFVQGSPAAILIVELDDEHETTLKTKAEELIEHFKTENFGYAYPIVVGSDIQKVWNLRKAGLGILGNMVGDAKPTPVIEDTAVLPELLPDYIREFQEMLSNLGLSCVYYAHISTGELHLRPILNMKDANGQQLFRQVALETAKLVKKYRGSLSGEHGDGRLRGEFIPMMLGEHVYQLLKSLKHVFDANNLFNQGKIVDTPPMDSSLRYDVTGPIENISTYFDFSDRLGWSRLIEQCTGAGDCRKSELFAGTMCPAFKASKEEVFSTRARANLLRELLITDKELLFDQSEIVKVLSQCLSCKACKKECPSSVDMTKLKAEFLQHHYDRCGLPFSVFLVVNLPTWQKIGSLMPNIYNFMVGNKLTSACIRHFTGFTNQRSLPKISKQSLTKWLQNNRQLEPKDCIRSVYLFADEFTNYLDVEVGIAFIKLLWRLRYRVVIPKHVESGRTALSKGMLKKAKRIASKNVELLSSIISAETPLVGLEPSTILSFRDEYVQLLRKEDKEKAVMLAQNVMLYDEFLCQLVDNGVLTSDLFTEEARTILLHGHCHQKSLASVEPTRRLLDLPTNYTVKVLPTGCCGMAGAYGYYKEHYEESMQIGRQTLFPNIEKTTDDVIISAPGTSCRTQIYDGTHRQAYHPVEVLLLAIK